MSARKVVERRTESIKAIDECVEKADNENHANALSCTQKRVEVEILPSCHIIFALNAIKSI